MKLNLLITFVFVSFILFISRVDAQDTFSMEAVDSTTGEIGDAGASCLGFTLPFAPHGCLIISDNVPGIGCIHTQAYWDSMNQKYAHHLMIAGYTPQQILDSLYNNDVIFHPEIRQYGITLYNGGHPKTGAYTGTGCDSFKNHIIGKYYTIQGNTLLGEKVLDSMEARFLRTKGPLAERLMAALQGAKMVGADTRCSVHNTSSLSSFLRVSKPTDDPGKLYIDLHMSYDENVTGKLKVDPIDSLQTLYNINKAGINNFNSSNNETAKLIYDNNTSFLDFTGFIELKDIIVVLSDIQGRIIYKKEVANSKFPLFDNENISQGIYTFTIFKKGMNIENGKVVK